MQFNKPKQELTASANLSYSPNWEDGDFTQNNQGNAAGLPILNINRQQNHAIGYNRIVTLQSDYVH
ncbi:outer membrane beta-barrel protein, partial [Umezakia ovalisporum]|uniref:outer membrane beta-barrel protein n=1 Tax=Umezakia ovalisporum TaxID=75695 RepID=UPI0039C60368